MLSLSLPALPFVRRTRVAVPRKLAALTAVDRDAECDPRDVGLNPKAVAAIWTAVERLYRTGLHPAMTLVLRRHGRIVFKRAIGCLRGNGPGERGPLVPLSPDAPLCLFSASKAVSALLIHKLAEEGRLRLEDLVVDYIPASPSVSCSRTAPVCRRFRMSNRRLSCCATGTAPCNCCAAPNPSIGTSSARPITR